MGMNANIESDFTDCENVDINRRLNEVYAATQSAVRLFSTKQDLEDDIKRQAKGLKSYWYFVFIVIGLVIDYVLRESKSGLDLNFGSFIWLLTAAAFLNGKYQLYKLEGERSKIGEKLVDIEYHWITATGANTFWELNRFIKDSHLDEDDENYQAWSLEQRHHILNTVCGYDKGKRIGSRELEAYNILKTR